VCEREKLELRTSVDAVQHVIHLDVVSPNPAAIMTRPQQEYTEYPLGPGYQGCLASLLRTRLLLNPSDRPKFHPALEDSLRSRDRMWHSCLVIWPAPSFFF
jgi:hypothetical protein